MSDVGAKPRKAMDPGRLRKLMDSPSVANTNREVPTAILNRQTQVTSWNGEQCDTRVFSKLAPTARVMLSKDLRACAVGEGTDVPLVPSGLQITDVMVRPDNQVQDQFTAPILTKKESFGQAPEIENRVLPDSVMLQEGIMTPQQRRERLHFETNHLGAKRAIHQAEMNGHRLHQIIKERHFTNNILANYPAEAPRIRGEPFKSNLLSHDGTGGPTRREYQSKNSSANPSMQSHGRLFNETPYERNQQRAQNLRNESTAGRPFDIVNGGRVEYFPPTIPEKQHRRQAHPSVVIHPYTR